MSDHVEQEMPEINGQPYIHDQVAMDVLKRGLVGKERYGTKLQPFNGRNAARDMYEEFLDGACYAKQVEIEMDALQSEIDQLRRELEAADPRRLRPIPPGHFRIIADYPCSSTKVDYEKAGNGDAAVRVLHGNTSRAAEGIVVEMEKPGWPVMATREPTPPFAHPHSGSNPERQSVGLPGHCNRCAEVGHVEAHPHFGCGDVGCTSDHGEEMSDD